MAARQVKAEELLEKLADRKRKALEKQLEELEELQKQAAAGTAVVPPPGV